MNDNVPGNGPIFSKQVDGLIAVLEAGGLEWSLQNSGPPFHRNNLAFVFADPPSFEGVTAAMRLVAHYKADAGLRNAMTDFALSQGIAFHEFGSAEIKQWRMTPG